MIAANELRIGNWYNEFDIPKQTDPQFILNLYQIELANKIAIDVSPIPLTPEILESCGFEKNEDAGNWNFKDYNIYANKYNLIGEKEGVFYWYRQTDDDFYSSMWPKLTSLHQLQNLYFALTGEELKINLHVATA